MIQQKDGLLLFMCITYTVAIYQVVLHYNDNGSISNIIGKEDCNTIILQSMVLMGVGTMLYECHRNENGCFFFIFCLLVGIYGVLFFDETTILHYGFANLVFFSIFGFMVYNCFTKRNFYLFCMLFLQILFSLFTFCSHFYFSNIFYGEAFMIIQFAVFYLYLHFYQEKKIENMNTTDLSTPIPLQVPLQVPIQILSMIPI